jgi:hypothetical protein
LHRSEEEDDEDAERPKPEPVPEPAPAVPSDDNKPPVDGANGEEKPPVEIDDMQNGRRFPKLRQLAVHELPKPNPALAPVFKCRMGSCGVFYHLECVKKHPLTNTTGMKKATCVVGSRVPVPPCALTLLSTCVFPESSAVPNITAMFVVLPATHLR